MGTAAALFFDPKASRANFFASFLLLAPFLPPSLVTLLAAAVFLINLNFITIDHRLLERSKQTKKTLKRKKCSVVFIAAPSVAKKTKKLILKSS